MTIDEVTARHPFLYHATSDGSWPTIQRHGLLCTSALLDLFQCNGQHRDPIEAARRAEPLVLDDPDIGRAVIRDQHPLNEARLAQVLDGMTIEEWYRTLNAGVFFWPTRDRTERLLRAYPTDRHQLLVIETRSLL